MVAPVGARVRLDGQLRIYSGNPILVLCSPIERGDGAPSSDVVRLDIWWAAPNCA